MAPRDKIIARAEQLVSTGDIQGAISEYDRLLKNKPEDVNTLNRIGDLWVRINRPKEAVNVFIQIADHYSRDGFFLKAIAIFKKINKLDPSRLEIYEKLAELYAKQGLAIEAKTQYLVLADYSIKQGNTAAALQTYRRISELDPNSINIQVKLADLYQQNGQTAEALTQYDRVGRLLLKKGMNDEALQVFQKVVNIDSSNSELISSIVTALNEAGQHSSAVDILKAARTSQEPRLVERDVRESARTSQKPQFVEGNVLADRYRVVRLIGRGGLGEVYEVVDLLLNDRLALKAIRKECSKDTTALERFKREIVIARQFSHPNICRVFDIGRHDDIMFLTMELVHGETLSDRLAHEGNLSEVESLALAEQIASVLAAAHEAGLIHGNLKSAKVMLVPRPNGSEPRVVVTDFGRSFEIVGEPSSGVREQVDGRAHTTAVDILALGVVLYEIATGREPFSASVEQILSEPGNEKFVSPKVHAPSLSPAFEEVILRCLGVDREDRYRSGLDVRLALRTVSTPALAESQPVRWRGLMDRASEDAFSPNTVLYRFPSPVAIAYRRFCDYENPTDHLWKLFSTTEALIRYLFTLSVSDLLACYSKDPGVESLPDGTPEFDLFRRYQKITLGQWMAALRKSTQLLGDQPQRFFRELPEILSSDGEAARNLGKLIQLRNQSVHPSGAISITPDKCADRVAEGRPLLERVLQISNFICSYPLGFCQRTLGQPSGSQLRRYFFFSCTGLKLANTEEAVVAEYDIPLAEDVPFVVAPDNSSLLYLWPMLMQRSSKLTGQRTLYSFGGLSDKKHSFLTQIRAEAVDVDETWTRGLAEGPKASHAWLFDQLRSMPATIQLPPSAILADELLAGQRGELVDEDLTPELKLVRTIGAGGFGTVYLGVHKSGEELAVKVLDSPDVRRDSPRFELEFKKLRDVGDRKGIIQCFDYGHALIRKREYPWYSMELAVGDLGDRIRERLKSDGSMPLETARVAIIDEMRMILESVAELHKLGIVHRDLKPGNVLVMQDGALKLSDFGLVKNLNPSEESMALVAGSSLGEIKGTRDYMAPEQERGETVDARADVYALGVLLTELASGNRPRRTAVPSLHGGSTLGGCKNTRRLPEGLRTIIFRWTDSLPVNRPRDASEALEQFEAGVTMGSF